MIYYLIAFIFIFDCGVARAMDCLPGYVKSGNKCIKNEFSYHHNHYYGFGYSYRRPNWRRWDDNPGTTDGSDSGGGNGDAGGNTLSGNDLKNHQKYTLVPVRSYLDSDNIPPIDVGAYGLVVLRAKSTDDTRHRLIMLCHSFIASLAKQIDLPKNISPQQQMLTIWPMKHPSSLDAQSDNCDGVLDDYDLTSADLAISDAVKQGGSFDGRGPYLVGWSPSSTRGVPDKLALIIDMSGPDSQAGFDDAFLFWKEKIIEDPARWRHGFEIESLRMALSNFSEKYGQAMLDAFKVVGVKMP